MSASHSGHRRFSDYDYSRGGAVFATAILRERKPLFGRVREGRMELSPAGEGAEAAILEAARAFEGSVRLHRHVVMPDHLHLRFSWPAGIEEPVRTLGAFVGRIKQVAHWRAAGRAPSIWREGWHDLLCTSARMNRCVDAYIDNNPLKHWVMHGDRSLLHVREPFLLPGGADGEIWRAVGNAALLDADRLLAVRISRRVPEGRLQEVVDALLRAAERGYRCVSTFFSPGEHRLLEALARTPGSSMVRLAPTFLDLAYRPRGAEPLLFAEKRLLVLSRMADPEAPPARGELLELNAVAARLALASHGGKAVYARWEGGELRW